MKKRELIKRITSVSLALTMAVSLATGCGKEKKDGDSILDEAAKGSKDYVFKQETFEVQGLDTNGLNGLKIVGDRIYLTSYNEDGFINVYSFNSDGSDLKDVKIAAEPDESFSYIDFDKDGNIYGILGKYNWFDGDMGDASEEAVEEISSENNDDNASDEASKEASDEASKEASDEKKPETVTEEASEEASDVSSEEASEDIDPEEGYAGAGYDEEVNEEYNLVKYDNAGNQVYKVKLGADLEEGDYYSPCGLVYSENYGLIVSSNHDISKFDEQSGFTPVIDVTAQYNGSNFELIRGYNGDIFVSGYTDEGRLLGTIDFDNKTIGNKSQALNGYNYYSFFSGNGYDVYGADDNAIYGYDLKSDKLVKLMDYVDSDLSLTYNLSDVVAVSDTELIAFVPDFDYNLTLSRLTKVPADQVKDRTIITLGSAYIDYHVRQAAAKFNQNNEVYRIKLVDYSTYNTEEDYDAGVKKFNLDVASGNVPDIMAFDLESPIESYINKGLFLDVSSYFNNDPDVGQAEYLDNIVDAFKTGDKMYQVVPYFEVATVICKASLLKGQTTLSMEDYRNLLQAKNVSPSKAFGLILRNDILAFGLAFSGKDYIDWGNKTCNFNSDSFVEFMEFINDFPQEYDENTMYYDDYDAAFRTDNALFDVIGIYGFNSFKREKYGRFGEDVAFVGFPGSKNTSVIYPGVTLCISSQTKYADGAWEFVKYFLSEEFQDSLDYDFPIRTSSYEKMKKASMEPEYYEDEDGNKQEVEEYFYVGDQEVKVPNLSQEDVDQIDNLVKNSHFIMYYNDNINNIISEEGSAYFSGQKSAKEVCDIIQSRLSIYVNENS